VNGLHETFNTLLLASAVAALVWILIRSRQWSSPMVLVALDQVRSTLAAIKKEVHDVSIQSASAHHRIETFESRLVRVEYKTAQHAEEIKRLNGDTEDKDDA